MSSSYRSVPAVHAAGTEAVREDISRKCAVHRGLMAGSVLALAMSMASGPGAISAQEAPDDRSTPSGPEQQELWSSAGPEGHAPMGVMGDHTHSRGEWMVSYIYTHMAMSGLQDGRESLDVDDVWPQYRMVPKDMTMDMHMGHLMYAPTDRLTLMGMFMYMDHTMDARMEDELMDHHGHGHGHEAAWDRARHPGTGLDEGHDDDHDHGSHHTHAHGSSGLADTEVGALYTIFDRSRQRVHLNASVSIPTGTTTADDPTMVEEHRRLPYPMQLGSGTWDVLPGVTYLGQSNRLGWGAQAMGTFRLGTNGEGYRLGHGVRSTAWGLLRGHDWLAPALRAEVEHRGAVDGTDPLLDPEVSPGADPSAHGGTRLRAFAGLNFIVPRGSLAGHRLAVEWGGPVLESLNGPQMSEDWRVDVGWEYAF